MDGTTTEPGVGEPGPGDPARRLAAAVARARRYPFEQPDGSYLFVGATTRPLAPDEIPTTSEDPPAFAGRTPVLAYASNASPDALRHKFGRTGKARIPVTTCRLDGFEAVYSRHFYAGYVPATLASFPGTTLLAYLTWLDPAEMELMNGSEHLGVNYELKPLAGGVARLESGREIDRPFAYHGLHGELTIEGRPVAVAGTIAENRRLPALDQDGILEAVRSMIAPDLSLEEMVAEALASRDGAGRLTAALKRQFGPAGGPSGRSGA